jgi:hypothetical protein
MVLSFQKPSVKPHFYILSNPFPYFNKTAAPGFKSTPACRLKATLRFSPLPCHRRIDINAASPYDNNYFKTKSDRSASVVGWNR